MKQPETAAAIFWLKNRCKDLWRDRHELDVKQPLASLSPEQRLAQVLEIMARARALLAANPPEDEDEDYTEAEESEK